jgi:hypothetical protein
MCALGEPFSGLSDHVQSRQTEQRCPLIAELVEVGITPTGLEVIERIDRDLASRTRQIAELEAQLEEWTAQLSADGILDFYNGIVDLVKGRIARAKGIAEINAALHDSLTGVWLSYDGETLTADVSFRPTGDDYWDECLMEMFGNLEPRPGAVEDQQEELAGQLPNTPRTCKASPLRRSSRPSTRGEHQ